MTQPTRRRTSGTIRPSEREQATREHLRHLFENSPLPREQQLENLELYMRPQRVSELFSFEQLYHRILPVHGVIMEFGVRWGRHLATLCALRAILEPYNFYRRIIGFDTFAGSLDPSPQDGGSDRVQAGSMAVSEGYEHHLEQVLLLHEAEAPLSHLRRTELCKGDAPTELARYLERQPETIVALAYFDMDLYQPTRDCLALLKPFLTKGSVLAFDELMHPEFPGETQALREALDLTQYRVERFSTAPYPCFIVL